MTSQSPAPPMTIGRAPGRAPGLLLIVPAALTALISLVLPTGQTIVRSFQVGGGVLDQSPKSSGLRNYAELLEHGAFWKALALSLSLAVVPLLVILVAGPLLAAALDRAGTWPRRVGRVLLSLPLVTFSPVAIAVAWFTAQRDGGVATAFGDLRDAGPASPTAPLITAAAIFGLLCGLALLVFLPVMRGRRQGRSVTPAMLAVGSITVLAAIAVALQAFSFALVLSSGRQPTLATLQWRYAWQYFQFGSGSALSTLTGLMLGVLGVLATVIAIRTGLRIELDPARPATDPAGPGTDPAGPGTDLAGPGTGPRPDGGGRAVIGVLALVVVVAVTVLCTWPWLSGIFSSDGTPPPRPPTVRVVTDTWLPPLLNAIVSVGTAFLAALGIGGLRPLGRRSEWLLLPFAPWLFVGVTPLSIAGFENVRHLHLVGHFLGLVSPILLSVPALLVLTLFCRTRSARWRHERAGGASTFFRLVALPALPLAALMGGVTVLFGAQGLLWPLLMSAPADLQTGPVALFRQTLMVFRLKPEYGLATPLVIVIVAFLILGALQLLYLDRLVIATGPSDDPDDAGRPGATFSAQPAPWPGPGYGPPPAYPAPPGSYGPPPAYPAPPSPYDAPPAHPAPPSPYDPPPGAYVPPPGSHGPPPVGHAPPPGHPAQPGFPPPGDPAEPAGHSGSPDDPTEPADHSGLGSPPG